MDGVLLSHLKSLHVPTDWTVRQFKREFILPRTKGEQTYADLLKSDESTKCFNKEKADVFISYAWDLKFSDVVASLPIDTDNPDRFVWMDVFCFKQTTDQKEAEEESSQTFFDRFKDVLKNIGKAELVIMPWKEPLPPKRSWCVFEYSVIVTEQLDYKCRMAPADKKSLKTHLKRNKTSSAFFSNLFGSINVLTAKAERKPDEKRILSIIEAAGTTVVNNAVMEGLKSWLEDVLNETLMEVEGRRNDEEANVICALGFLCNSLGRFDDAQIAFENSLTMYKKLSEGKPTHNIIALKSNLALVLVEKGNIEEAETLLREVYKQVQTRSWNETSTAVAIAASNLANVLRKSNRFDEAEELYIEAISLFQHLDNHHIRPSLQTHDLGEEQLVDMSERQDLQRLQVAVCYNNLGRLYQKKHQHERAVTLFRKALAIDLAHYDDFHPEVATDLHNMARSLNELGQRPEALEKGQRALEIFTRAYGEMHPITQSVSKAWLSRLSRAGVRPISSLTHQPPDI